jgi:hypothetical protein
MDEVAEAGAEEEDQGTADLEEGVEGLVVGDDEVGDKGKARDEDANGGNKE